jgi:hypothetical protein
MPTTLVRLLIAVVLLLCFHVSAFAQAVQVAPGYVRAPFVRVYRTPDGGTHVRAPFTDIYTNDRDDDDDWDDDDRWRMRRRAPYDQPTRATRPLAPQQLSVLDWNALRGALAQAVANFERDLSRMPTGEHWRLRFRTEELASYAQIPNDGPPSDDVLNALYDTLDIFADAQADPQLNAITRMRSFGDVQAVIAEYVSPPDSRLRLQLQGSSLALQAALGRFNTGDGWKRHLTLPDVIYVRGDAATAGDIYPSDEDLEQLHTALDHFDAVRQDARYAMISDLPAFVSTHALVGQYLAMYEAPADAPPAEFEALPVPVPAE